jgi:hypothetical protein
MGTQNQNPSSQPQQPGTRQPGAEQNEERPDRSPKGSTKAKDAGNVPRSDDELTDEGNEGTREDGAGSNVRNN